MNEIYLLKNQNDEFLDKSGEWVTTGDAKSLYRSPHKDEAINQKVELAVKNPTLRIVISTACYDESGKILLNDEDLQHFALAGNKASEPATPSVSEPITSNEQSENTCTPEAQSTDVNDKDVEAPLQATSASNIAKLISTPANLPDSDNDSTCEERTDHGNAEISSAPSDSIHSEHS